MVSLFLLPLPPFVPRRKFPEKAGVSSDTCYSDMNSLNQPPLSLYSSFPLGFLSENAGFAEKVEKEGFVWVGPTSDVIRSFGLKHTARELAVGANVSWGWESSVGSRGLGG